MMGVDGCRLSCSGSSVVAEHLTDSEWGERDETPDATETNERDLLSSAQFHSLI